MKLRLLLPVALCAALVAAQEITTAVSDAPDLSSLSEYLDKYPKFTAWLKQQENITFLAPSNRAFASLGNSSLPSDEGVADALLRYHVLKGTYADFPTGDLEYIHSSLESSQYANVTGGQIVAAQKSQLSSATTFWSGLRTPSTTTSSGQFNFAGGVGHIVDRFLTLPQQFTGTVETQGYLGGLMFDDAELPLSPGSRQVQGVDQLSDVTIFLPMNTSLEQIGSIFANMSRGELDRILSYHVVNQVLDIDLDNPPTGNYTTLEGSDVTIFYRGGYAFVNSARIVGEANWLFSGGSIYTIYGVLNPDNSTVDRDITDSQVAFARASAVKDVTFPSATSTPSQTNRNGTTTQADQEQSSSGLSTGAKAGIGAGVAVGVLVLIGLLVAAIVSHRRRRRAREQDAAQYYSKPPLPTKRRSRTASSGFGRGNASSYYNNSNNPFEKNGGANATTYPLSDFSSSRKNLMVQSQTAFTNSNVSLPRSLAPSLAPPVPPREL